MDLLCLENTGIPTSHAVAEPLHVRGPFGSWDVATHPRVVPHVYASGYGVEHALFAMYDRARGNTRVRTVHDHQVYRSFV